MMPPESTSATNAASSRIEDAEPCRFRTAPVGVSVLWEVSRFCNLECRHCCTASSPFAERGSEVGPSRALEIARGFGEADVRNVMYSGGEPFLWPGFIELLQTTRASGVTTYIATNGTTMTDRLARQLTALGIAGVDISLDGHTAPIHNAVRMRRSAFEHAVRGIRLCVAAGLPLRVSGMITPANVGYVRDYVALLVSLGVRRTVLQTVVPDAGTAKRNPDLALEQSAYPTALSDIAEARREFGSVIVIDERLSVAGDCSPGCPAGRTMLHIDPDGDVSGCSWLYKLDANRFRLGNIKGESLLECLRHNDRIMAPVLARTSWCPIPIVQADIRRLRRLV